MPIHDLYHKRMDADKVKDVYVYDDIPTKVRIQIYHIIKKSFSILGNNALREVSKYIEGELCAEFGFFYLEKNTSPLLNVC